jgi:hypothetical protein
VPLFGYVVRIVQNYEALDLCACEERRVCCSGLPTEYAKPALSKLGYQLMKQMINCLPVTKLRGF